MLETIDHEVIMTLPYKDGKLVIDGEEIELSKSDIKYLDRKVEHN